MRTLISVFVLSTFTLCPVLRAAEHEKEGFRVFIEKDIQWKDGPPTLPKGAQMAVLEGDPSKEGPFVIRFKTPDGYRIPLHTHQKAERVTVISGIVHIGMGDKVDDKLTKPMPAGSFGLMEAGMKHFAWTKGETVVQLHGIGPWSIEYVDPKDDPRNQKE